MTNETNQEERWRLYNAARVGYRAFEKAINDDKPKAVAKAEAIAAFREARRQEK